MITVEEIEDIDPICPFCTKELRKILCRQLGGFFGKRYVYFCANCRKVLGVSHRKGFWMG